jgi:hypothetical protein
VEIDSLGGSWFTNIAVEGLTITPSAGVVRAFKTDRLAFAYLLPQLLGTHPQHALQRLELPGAELTLDFSELTSEQADGAPEESGLELAGFLKQFPSRLLLESGLDIRVRTPGDYNLAATLELSGSGAEGIETLIRIDDSQELLPWEEALFLPVTLTLSERTLLLEPRSQGAPLKAADGALPVELSGNLSINEEGEAEQLALEISAASLFLSLKAGSSSASAEVAFEPQRAVPLETPLLFPLDGGNLRIGSGSLELHYEKQKFDAPGPAEQLLDDPATLTRSGSLSYRASIKESRLGILRQLEGTVAGRLEGQRLSVQELRARADGGLRVEAKGTTDLETLRFSLPQAELSLPSLARLRPILRGQASWLRQLAGSLRIEGDLQGDLSEGGIEAVARSLSGTLEARAASLRVADLEVDRLAISSTFDAGIIELSRLEAESAGLLLESSSTLTLEPKRRTIRVDSARLSVENGLTETFELASPTRATFSPKEVRLEETLLSSAVGSVRLRGSLDAAGIHGRIEGEGVSAYPLARTLGVPGETRGYISFLGSVDGELREPRLRLRVSSRDLRYRGVPTRLTLSLRQEGGALRVEELEVTRAAELALKAEGRLPLRVSVDGVHLLNLRSAGLTLSATHENPAELLPKEYAGYLPRERVRLDLSLAERSGDLRIEAIVEARGDETATENGAPKARIYLRVREGTGDRLMVESAGRLEGEKVASLEGELSVPGLAEANPTLDLEEVALELSGNLSLPLREVGRRIPSVIFAGGPLLGELRLYGTLARPKYEGNLRVMGGEFRLAGPLPPVTAVSGELIIAEGEAQIRGFRGELGRAPFTASGRLTFPRAQKPAKINLTIAGENLLLYSDETLRVRGDSRIEVSRSLRAPLISGHLTVREAVYEQDIPLIGVSSAPSVDPESLQLFAFPGGWAGQTALDITVEGDRSVLVRNNLLDTTLSVDLHLRGNLEVPIMTGRVFTREAALRLPVTTVDLSQLAVEFPQGDPFRPRIAAIGNSQVRGYELMVQASGTVPAVEVEVSSAPPLPREQALLLLTTGYADLGDLGPGERTVRALSRFVGRQLVEVLLAESQVEEVVAERVEVRVGRQVSESGSEVIEVEFQLTEEQRWFLEFERDRFDAYNLGVAWRLWFN